MTDAPRRDDRRYVRPGDAWESQLLAGVSVPVGELSTHQEVRDANLVVDDVVAKLAALTVRRQCNQHVCTLPATGVCDHEDARRDVDYMRHILDVLGLPGSYADVAETDRAELLQALSQRSTVTVASYAEVISD